LAARRRGECFQLPDGHGVTGEVVRRRRGCGVGGEERVGRRRDPLARTERGEFSGAIGARADRQPVSRAVEYTGAEVECDGKQPVTHRHAVGGNRATRIVAGVAKQREAQVVTSIRWRAAVGQAALVRERGAEGGRARNAQRQDEVNDGEKNELFHDFLVRFRFAPQDRRDLAGCLARELEPSKTTSASFNLGQASTLHSTATPVLRSTTPTEDGEDGPRRPLLESGQAGRTALRFVDTPLLAD